MYVIDTLSFQLIDTLKGVGVNITSLAASGNQLLIGEGNNYGGSGYRLLALDINPGSQGYHDFVRGLRRCPVHTTDRRHFQSGKLIFTGNLPYLPTDMVGSAGHDDVDCLKNRRTLRVGANPTTDRLFASPMFVIDTHETPIRIRNG